MRRVNTALRHVGGDLSRVIRGTVAFFRYLCGREEDDVGLGLFSAGSSLARRGKPSEYVVRVANAARQPREVTLAIAIAAAYVEGPAAGDCARFTRPLLLQPRASQALTIRFTWVDGAWLHIDGASSPPDDSCRGKLAMPQLYALSAFLADGQGRRLDGLTIYQELVE